MFLSQHLREKIDFYHAFLSPNIEEKIEEFIKKSIEIEKHQLRAMRSGFFSSKAEYFIRRMNLFLKKYVEYSYNDTTNLRVFLSLITSKLTCVTIIRSYLVDQKGSIYNEIQEVLLFILGNHEIDITIHLYENGNRSMWNPNQSD